MNGDSKPDDLPAAHAPSLGPIELEILRQLRSISFGSMEIIIHDSRIVQVERRDKVRFDAPARSLR